MTYKNLVVVELSSGLWLAQAEILTPKKYTLQYSNESEKVAREAIENYLKSQNAVLYATEEN